MPTVYDALFAALNVGTVTAASTFAIGINRARMSITQIDDRNADDLLVVSVKRMIKFPHYASFAIISRLYPLIDIKSTIFKVQLLSCGLQY
jgi:hypothetical protein